MKDTLNGRILNKYRKLVDKKLHLESIFIIGSVCIFAFITSFICKFTVGTTDKNTELILEESKRNYYLGEYDKGVEEIKTDKEEWTINTMEKSKIYSIKGDIEASNALA